MGLVEDIRQIVVEASKSGSNYLGRGILDHALSVTLHAKKLAHKVGADIEIVEIAALLHDYASIKDRRFLPEHHIHGAREAEEILQNLGYAQERIEKVKHCIYAHRGSTDIPRETIEAECVANADAMSHFEMIPSLLRFVFVKKNMNTAEATDWVRAKLERSWNKLTPEAKELVKDKYEASKIILKPHH